MNLPQEANFEKTKTVTEQGRKIYMDKQQDQSYKSFYSPCR